MASRIVKEELTAIRLRELLKYNPDTGEFVWRVSCRGTKAGDTAGTSGSEGRRHITIGYSRYKAHRLAWLYIYGNWPKGLVDHINVIPSDNRISNLRIATVSQNQTNQRSAHCQNKTGLLGAHWHTGKKKFKSRITIDGKEIFLGYYDTAELAHAAYMAKKAEIHPFGEIAKELAFSVPQRGITPKSGIRGVRMEKRVKSDCKWSARIMKNGTLIHLGVFDTKELASEAYEEAKKS